MRWGLALIALACGCGTYSFVRTADTLPAGEVIKRVKAAGIPFDGAAHHGVSTAVYLRDPDGNGVELYYDLAESLWPKDAEGGLTMMNQRFSIDAFIAETEAGAA